MSDRSMWNALAWLQGMSALALAFVDRERFWIALIGVLLLTVTLMLRPEKT